MKFLGLDIPIEHFWALRRAADSAGQSTVSAIVRQILQAWYQEQPDKGMPPEVWDQANAARTAQVPYFTDAGLQPASRQASKSITPAHPEARATPAKDDQPAKKDPADPEAKK